MRVAVVSETFPGERRVALVPRHVASFINAGVEVMLQSGAGDQAGFSDGEYEEHGARILSSRRECFSADVLLQVRSLGANPDAEREDLELLHQGLVIIGTCDPLGRAEAISTIAKTNATQFALELIPRITRAQSMDVLSSMATLAGYRAVLLGACELPKMFPLMMTAAGTLSAARVFVIGAGVAGLQAIATARRLGAVVRGYDVRPDVREQVESLGARFVELQLDTKSAEDEGGYARAMSEEFYQRQRELMASIAAESDVIVTTAAIPGKRSPRLITADAVQGMQVGSVIVDLAAERGGNCELSQADTKIVEHGVTILGPTNLPSEVPNHASQMFSKNVTTFLLNMVEDGQLNVNLDDEIVLGTLTARQGEVVHPRVREILGMTPNSILSATSETPSTDPTETAAQASPDASS